MNSLSALNVGRFEKNKNKFLRCLYRFNAFLQLFLHKINSLKGLISFIFTMRNQVFGRISKAYLLQLIRKKCAEKLMSRRLDGVVFYLKMMSTWS